MIDDTELLRRYAQERAEAPFAELVRRHIDVVYATARRACHGHVADAQDITQLVFTALARQAPQLARHPALLGWLHTTTRYTAMKHLRTESRRQAREQHVVALDAAFDGNEAASGAEPPIDREQLQPMLDAVLGELKDRERAAILLRFFEGKSLLEVGASLQLSETAARSCVDRALDKLRDRLVRRGLTSTSAALGLALAQSAGTAAPAGLAASVASTAFAAAAAPGAGLVALFTMKKILVGIAGVLLAAEFATATVEFETKRELDADFRTLQSAANPSAMMPSIAANGAEVADARGKTTATGDDREVSGLRRRLAQLKARPHGVVDAQMRPPANVGRATAQDAMKTMAWASAAGDWDTLMRFATFSDDSKENREAFMANFSAAIRARYPTPERVVIAVSFDEALRDPPVAEQLIDSHSFYTGMQTVGMWVRTASGREEKKTLPFQESPDGWVLLPLSLTGKESAVALALSRLDPATGDVLPPKK